MLKRNLNFLFLIPLFLIPTLLFSQVDTAWVRRYNGPGNSSDAATALAIDNLGNVYVTGESPGSGTSYDYATIKYDANGNQLWVARYNGPGNSSDVANAIVVDNSGNVYVTGLSTGSGTSSDYATIKYNASGTQLWVARYNGPGNSGDGANALAIDNLGNVYVTGRSTGSGTSSDYATIKYDANGNQLWVARYNGPGNSLDIAYALAIDNLGNVYVTGRSTGSGTSSDYATIKYNASGTQLWVARYNGPENNYDEGFALAVDNSGNVYVTGSSVGSGISEDYATIKYDANGNQLWVARYNGPGNNTDQAFALAVDNSGNVYVAGYSLAPGTSYDYATIKYYENRDVGCIRILAPTGTINQGTVIVPACSVYNYGLMTVSYTVRMKIGTLYSQTATVTNHAPGTRRYVTFPNWYASELGTLAVSCSTELSGDIQPGNDKATGSVFVQSLDAQCVSIDAPTGTLNQGVTIQPKATIKNNGNTTQNITARLIIEDGSGYNYTVSHSLDPNQELEYTFPDWTANNLGSWVVKCTTELNGDMNTTNDKQTGSVFVQSLDAQCVSIDAPTGTVNLGDIIQPKATVKNNGNTEKTFNVRFWIQGTKYEDVQEITLGPGGETQVTFANWTAGPVGTLAVKCTVELNGDMNNANDKQEGLVTVQTGGPPPTGWQKVTDVPKAPSNKAIKSGGLIVFGGDKIYIVKGNNTKDFYAFIPDDAPTSLDSVKINGKKGVKKGTGMVYDGTRYLYFAPGTGTLQFWRYDTENNAWESLPPIPLGPNNKTLKGGTGMAYANGKVYLLKGSKTNEFYAFDCADNTWIQDLPSAPGDKGYGDGSCLIAYDNNTLYALRGKYNEFYKYDISANTWEKDSGMPFTHPLWNKKKKVGEGAAMTLKGNRIYAFKGNNTKEFWSFDPATKWAGLETIPKMPDKKYVKGGGLCTWGDGTIYALKGNNTTSIWKYTGNKSQISNLKSQNGEQTRELSYKPLIKSL
ncbi:MAG: SBBP repeat-containing protein, partial [candidate division WOR-3 bacterium]